MSASPDPSTTSEMHERSTSTISTAIFYTIFVGVAVLMTVYIVIKRCRSNNRDISRYDFEQTINQTVNQTIPQVEQPAPGVAAAPLQWPPPDMIVSNNQSNDQSNNQSIEQSNNQSNNQTRFERFKKLFHRHREPASTVIELEPPLGPPQGQSFSQTAPSVPPPSYIDCVKTQKFCALKINIPINQSNNQSNNQTNNQTNNQIMYQIEPSYVRSPSRSPTLIDYDREIVDPPSYAKHWSIKPSIKSSNDQSNNQSNNQSNHQSNNQTNNQSNDPEVVGNQHVVINVDQ